MYEYRKIAKFPKNTEQGFRDAVYFLKGIKSLEDIYQVKSYHFEKYKVGKYKGKHSIRCDRQFRLIMDIETNPELILILEEVVDPH
ncbi:MAG: type II toxin-antitoxin system RelE/ParE family toxin [Candidatus Peribacteria bacterium]|nr:type II toxin-antitoxin system RelE/ParE family toxin [Candidatus Peribacteria bacterium]